MRIAFVGSRGIPAKYGGNETFVEEIAKELLKAGFSVYVTCESHRFFRDVYDGVIRLHVPALQGKSLTILSVNDLISTMYLFKNSSDVDVIYYVAPDGALAAILAKLWKKKVLINPDGVEWRRLLKRSRFVPFYLKPFYLIVMIYMYIMEWFSCKVPEVTVADSLRIKEHLENRHNAKNVVYITYGARRLINFKMSREEELRILAEYELLPREYYLTVARIVAENNIDMEVEGFKKSKSTKKLVIVGNFNEKDPFSRYLLNLRDGREEILYLTPIYDRKVLGVLRKNCFAYIHAYEVGGTNPSLLEQMLFKRPVLAYDVPFNREVLQEGGIYFEDAEDLARKIKMLERGDIDLKLIKKTQIKRITRRYNWEKVAKEYKCLFRRLSY
jgi:glycosyltransferase involved in cell wall biosynthesis